MKQQFIINKYDWEVVIFYYVNPTHKEKIFNFFYDKGYYSTINDINIVIGLINGGYCYTNFNDRRSILVINYASSPEQMYNTLVHELNHLSSHIEEYYNIDPHSEEAAYLIGDLAQKTHQFIN